ncbi:DUF2461 family protein [Streptomyces sp. NPDC002764]|uniref:DUF2461 family protein n=1 Tax=unclassified Streptomyces TaxID=2593676 RepID=UPI003318C45A
MTGDLLKRVPRDHPADHHRADMLRHRSLLAVRHHGCDAWLQATQAVDRVPATHGRLRPLLSWLTTHVTPWADRLASAISAPPLF